MAPQDEDGLAGGTDWERYAAEMGDAWKASPGPMSDEPRETEPAGPRDWTQGELDDEKPEAADDVLDSTYEAQDPPFATRLEKILLAVVVISIVLIILSEISVITLSPTMFIVVVVAAGAAAVAWIMSYATGSEDDDGMRV
ncbi:hypothetical protein [Flaviflexus huanghaiensis]|uniref:hypothetical protein n=1 Tax=Flaviflexus huanghaiensis TaxID=1111473 RepID=UPI0015F9C01A|nr:hypothetical protein [Flaviflexus huanghaiensis]